MYLMSTFLLLSVWYLTIDHILKLTDDIDHIMTHTLFWQKT